MESFKVTRIGWHGTIVILLVLFLPTIMAWSRRRHHAPAITVCNLAVGVALFLASDLTAIGAFSVLILSPIAWLAALVWSLFGTKRNLDPQDGPH